MSNTLTFLCIACYFKGGDFLRACKEEGHTVFLLTKKDLEDKPWPRESIDEFFFMKTDENTPDNLHDLMKGLAFVLQNKKVDRIVALDDFDVEKAAFLREQFRIPGMGQTTSRYFRDKLAMRMKAAEGGIPVPPFSALFNDQDIRDYVAQIPAPWVVKPRSQASATGIKKINSEAELWPVLEQLGEERHHYLIEQFKPGDVFHADALTVDKNIQFCQVSKYMDTPFEVAHGGGIFRSHTLEADHPDDKALKKLNEEVLKAFGMHFSASHTEFIKSKEDGKFYFLETSCRVGGAHLADMVEAASGINLWKEWAKIESAMALNQSYSIPTDNLGAQAGIIISLSSVKHPDTSSYADPEIVWRMNREYHIGLVVQSKEKDRVTSLLDDYANRIYGSLHASAPVKDKPSA